jgi:uncharacterized protein (UPF0297 family)
MISSQGSQSSDFDVLNSQRGGSDDAVHVIKINKKIGDTGFPKSLQPTELNPVIPPASDGVVASKEEVKKPSGYIVPKEILDYLDILIVKKKIPLRTLKFDIEFSKSKEEIAKHLEEHSSTVNNIDKSDLDKLFGFIGYAEPAVVPEENDADVQNENVQEIAQATVSENLNQNIVKEDTKPVDLKLLRDKYSSLRIEYLKKIKQDKYVYKMMMNQLGGNKSMPDRPEPINLTEARKEYYQARSSQKMSREVSINESVLYAESEIPNFSIKTQERLKKALSTFDSYSNLPQVSEALLSADFSAVEKIIDPDSFGGMRVTSAEIKNDITPVDIIETEPRKPELDAVLLPSEKLLKMESAKTEEVKVEVATPKYNPEDVKVELMLASGANFLPKKVVEPEKIAEEVKKEEVVTEKVEEKQVEETKKEEVSENAEKPAEMPPVDSIVADKPAEAQNVFPTEFEDKRLEVHHGFPGNPNEIKVSYDGKEIAKGLVGGKIAINKEFKAGFLLADTQEQRALKYAHTIIKTLKVVKQ